MLDNSRHGPDLVLGCVGLSILRSSAESVGELAPSRGGMKKKNPLYRSGSRRFPSRSRATMDLDSASKFSPTVRKGRHFWNLAAVRSLSQPTDSLEGAVLITPAGLATLQDRCVGLLGYLTRQGGMAVQKCQVACLAISLLRRLFSVVA